MKKTTLRHVGQSMAEGSFNLALQIKNIFLYIIVENCFTIIYRGSIIFRITALLISLCLLLNLLYANTYCTNSI